MPPREGYVTADDGVRLFFRALGDGPKPVVIPNGFHLLEDFARLAPGRTLIFYDLRNRGRSDRVDDADKLKGGVHNDVDDLEAVRRQFGIPQLDAIGHSYVGVTVVLYAMKYAPHVRRLVQVGPSEPRAGKQYPAHLTGADATLRDVFAKIGQLQKERGSEEPEAFCRKFWSILRLLYVTNQADADKINWGRCDLPNERGFMKHWIGYVFPSLQALDLGAEDFARVKMPVLTVHGTKDRAAPYGGGREWAMRLPDARLVTIENGGHAPWIEAPDGVFGSIGTFLDGAWPDAAERIASLDPASRLE
jgi:proline iminopeptidase